MLPESISHPGFAVFFTALSFMAVSFGTSPLSYKWSN